MLFARVLPQVYLCLTLITLSLVFLLLSTRRSPLPLLETKIVDKLKDRPYFPATPNLCHHGLIVADLCASFPDDWLDKVQVTVKTGIAERHSLESLLSSYGSCISNLLIISDAKDNVQDRHVHDILADLPASYAQDNSDWSFYEIQRQAVAAGDEAVKSQGGWRLDRFKFIPMVEHAYANNPNAEWYVFLETDTYLFWDVLFRLLEKLNPSERHYLGSAVPGAYDRWFAYGGAAIVLSHGLLQDLPLQGDQRLSVKYERTAREDCCGDAVLAYVFHAELGVRLENMYPSTSGEEPQWLWISQSNWCTPLVSLHHVSAETLSTLWHWERCKLNSELARPITFATLLAWGLPSASTNDSILKARWDNGADVEQDEGSPTHGSSITCFQSCQEDPDCLQASYGEGKCRFAERLRIGQAVDAGIESFWDTTKMKRLGWHPGEAALESCSEAKWLSPTLMVPPKDLLQKLGLKSWP